MECFTSVSYSILVNDEPKGMITPLRGLRQGGSSFSIFIPVLCGGVKCLVMWCGFTRRNSWVFYLQEWT